MLTLKKLKPYHDLGFSLLYLAPKSKRPIEREWTKVPRMSWEMIENSIEPDYNIGVRLGAPSKVKLGKGREGYLMVIDCDVKSRHPKHLEEMETELAELADAIGLDMMIAPVVQSGRGNGSRHIYCLTAEPMRPMRFKQAAEKVKVPIPSVAPNKVESEELTKEELKKGLRIRHAWEISLMSTGQQVVLPPSVHPDSGLEYEWKTKLAVDRLSIVDVSSVKRGSEREIVRESTDFKAVDVDLFDGRIPKETLGMILSGEGVEDRSAACYSIALSLCRLGFTDNEILTVLTDADTYIGQIGYDHTRSGKRDRAANWIFNYTLKKARFETQAARVFERGVEVADVTLSDEEASEQEKDFKQDARRLPDLTGKGDPKSSLRNVLHVLEHHREEGEPEGERDPLVRYDEFSNRLIYGRDTPFGGKRGEEVSDIHDLKMKSWIASHYRFEPSKELCFEAHNLIGHRNAFHPVRDYLNGLEWDGVDRLDHWLKRAFRAEGKAEYLAAVGRKVLTGAVARIFDPGCKFDYVMVIEGAQGKGKSTALGILAGDKWFNDNLGDIHQKDVVDNMAGKWIIELSEMASIKKADVDHLKAFVSRPTDRIRLPYGKRAQDFPRQCIFIGTTNADEYFTDETGNRRFWCVRVSDDHEVDRRWLKENRDQLFAEAVATYRCGETLYLGREIEELASRAQEKRFMVDEWEPKAKRFIKEYKGRFFTTTDAWLAVTGSVIGTPELTASFRLGRVLRRLDCKRTTFKKEGIVMKGWKILGR